MLFVLNFINSDILCAKNPRIKTVNCLIRIEAQMGTLLQRSKGEPKREGLSWKEKWEGSDKGLITCWEVGREKRLREPELAEKAEKGELPVLGWKGGVERKLEMKEKYGSLNYLAQWQGLRGEDLEINTEEEKAVICSRTGMIVIYTADLNKYALL